MEEREITESERLATDIINNRENPQHQKYWQGESATVRHVDALWDKAFPGEQNGDGPLQARLDAAVRDSDANGEGAVMALQEQLRHDPEFGGANFEQNLAAAQRAHVEIFGERSQEMAAEFDLKLDESEKLQAIRLLAKIGGKRN